MSSRDTPFHRGLFHKIFLLFVGLVLPGRDHAIVSQKHQLTIVFTGPTLQVHGNHFPALWTLFPSSKPFGTPSCASLTPSRTRNISNIAQNNGIRSGL
ncbi:hypothetical protein QBC37DRAFT_423503 [Rhypophila decipiens]|uniref:Secreted protein n=1 Tax=Rhypophila decipiens TaxID=261697 RepID=A0AAN7B9N6_9PEZI|nr:hypothetical protein QBC37DRAFT_423503 [Rhypophila decipiens]